MAKDKDISIFWMLVKFVTPVIVILSFLPGPTGKPIIAWSDYLPSQKTQDTVSEWVGIEELPRLSDFTSSSSSASKTKTTVHKWQDENGQWHFSERAPMNQKSQSMQVSNAVNSMPAPPKVGTAGHSNSNNSSSGLRNTQPPTVQPGLDTSSLPYGNVKKLIDEAKNLQNLADERAKTLNGL